MWTLLEGTCDQCGNKLKLDFSISIDVVEEPLLKDKFIAGQLIPHICPYCGKKRPVDWLCVYWEENWIGINLAPTRSIPAISAIHQTMQLLETCRPDREILPKLVRVFGTMDELLYVVEHAGCSVFRQYFDDLLGQHWDGEIEELIQIADLFLANSNPVDAFATIATTIQVLPDIYLYARIRKAIRLCAYAANDLTLEKYGVDRTPLQELDGLQEALAGQVPDIMSKSNFTLCYDTPCLKDGSIHPSSWVIIERARPSSVELLLMYLQLCIWHSALRAQHKQEIPNPREVLTGRKDTHHFRYFQAQKLYAGLDDVEKKEIGSWFSSVTNQDLESYLEIK